LKSSMLLRSELDVANLKAHARTGHPKATHDLFH